jgi:3-oxoacyl-[acyl-carrier protein] reductase
MANKTVLITGASRGIGAAIACRFAAAGERVLINYHRSRETAQSLLSAMRRQGWTVDAFAADVTDPEAVAAMFDYAETCWQHPVSVLVNNAGTDLRQLISETAVRDFDRLVAVNLKAPFLCCQRALPAMLQMRRGCIVNIGSVFGQTGAAFEAVYAASKGALTAFTLSLAAEIGSCGIRAHLIAPGAVDTDMLRRELDPEELESLRQAIPLRRLGTPDDIAAACVFLASPQASYLQGQILTIDGGWTL